MTMTPSLKSKLNNAYLGDPRIALGDLIEEAIAPSAPNPRNIFVGQGSIETVAQGIADAELLEGSAEDDPIGVTVWIPAGFFDEEVLIRRNVNLVGAGAGATKLAQVTYRPTDDTLAPTSCRLMNLSINNIVTRNETAEASGIFNRTTMLSNSLSDAGSPAGLVVSHCTIKGYDIKEAFGIWFYRCQLENLNPGVSVNVSFMWFIFCLILGDVEHTANSEVPNAIYDFEDGPDKGLSNAINFYMSFFGQGTLDLLTDAESNPDFYRTGASMVMSHFSIVNFGPNTAGGIRNCQMPAEQLTIDALASVSLEDNTPWKPAEPTDWPDQPVNTGDALNKLAARVAVLEP